MIRWTQKGCIMFKCYLKSVLFMLGLVCLPVGGANIAIEPYLQVLTEDSVQVVWWTDSPSEKNVVHIDTPKRMTANAVTDNPSGVQFVRHLATVTGLMPSTDYEYYVESDGARSQQYHFRSAITRDKPFRFVFLGDGRNDNNEVIIRHRAVYKAAMDLNPSLIVYGGDAVQYGAYSTHEKTWESFFRQICTNTQGGLPAASTIPHYFVVGNHEIYDPKHDGYASGGLAGTSMARFQAFCVNPNNGCSDPRWRGRYYAFTHGCATFVVLDLNNTSNDALDNHDKIPDGYSPDWEPGSEQYDWMIEQLKQAKNTSAFTFVFAHPAPYSRGAHGTSDKTIDYQRGFELRALDPVFREHGVDAVFTSHDHMVERCLTGPGGFWEDMDVNDPANLNYIVQGNSGHSARDPHPEWRRWMQIPNAPPETYYTVWFYDWNKTKNRRTVRCSLTDVQVSRISASTWETKIQVVSVDGLLPQMRYHDVSLAYDDVFKIRRADPVFSGQTDASDQVLLTRKLAGGPNAKKAWFRLTPLVTTTMAIAALAVAGAVSWRRWRISKS